MTHTYANWPEGRYALHNSEDMLDTIIHTLQFHRRPALPAGIHVAVRSGGGSAVVDRDGHDIGIEGCAVRESSAGVAVPHHEYRGGALLGLVAITRLANEGVHVRTRLQGVAYQSLSSSR